MSNLGRGIAIIVVLLTAWFFWPRTVPLGGLVVVELTLDATHDPAKPLTFVLDPPIRLSNELLRQAEPLGPCAGRACGAVDPRSRRIMMGKTCSGEPDCRAFAVPEVVGSLYVLGRVFSRDDTETLKRELEGRFVGRTLATVAQETVMIRRVFTVDVNR